MFFLRNSLFLVALLLVAVGCSSGDSDDVEAEESSAEEVADSDVDMEELEEEFGVTEGEDAEIPELLPADLYVTDDMEIEHTVVNELMSQLRYETDKSYDELIELYSDYLSNNNAFSEYEENLDIENMTDVRHSFFSVMYEGNTMEVSIIEDESFGDVRMVDVTLYDDDVLDEMLDDMQEQMEED